jgi:hyaluronoglucosaminidase
MLDASAAVRCGQSTGSGRLPVFPLCAKDRKRSVAQMVVGAELAMMLQADLLTFQHSGLDRLGDRTEKLRTRYATIDHPVAREVIDCLSGGYAITGEMSQTQ